MKKSHTVGWVITGFIAFYLLYAIKDDLLYYQPKDRHEWVGKINASE